MSATNLRIDADRLWSTIGETARFGGTPKGGVRRLALSDEDKAVRDWLVAALTELGLEVAVDDMGTIYGTRPGTDPARLPVAFGSHLDTQPTGGRFDGILGVLAGLEVLRRLDEAGIRTKAPLTLVNWTNEEGARFAPGMTASGVYAGALEKPHALALTDREGLTFGGELARIGYAGSEPAGQRAFGAFLELHIEQGPVLEAQGKTIGVVTHAKGQVWFDVAITGREAHAGTTPMPLRRDALLAAAEMALAVEAIALASGPEGVGTVGVCESGPGSRNTIPGYARFTVEFRHPDAQALSRAEADLRAAAFEISRRRTVEIAIDRIWTKSPVAFDAKVAGAIKAAAEALSLPSLPMTSGAGHDALYVAARAPTAMVFVPCLEGISHNEAESATPADCAAGADVLLHAILALAEVEA